MQLLTMEGSSESNWRNSSNRGVNFSAFSDRNPRVLDALRDSGSGFSRADCVETRVGSSGICEDELALYPIVRSREWDDVSLRHWLDNPERSVDSLECLHIFLQIVDIVNLAHSQGVVVHNARPSCFVMSSFNRISFIESASCSDSGSHDSSDDGSSPHVPCDLDGQQNNLGAENSQVKSDPENDARIESETSYLQSSSVNAKHPFPMKQILLMESSWYTSPEELAGAPSSCASDVYRLGVLLFELFSTFSSPEEKSSTMACLRHRVLPPQLLLKWPKVASFCLWLLHPQPSSRPKMGELLTSEFLTKPRESLEEREAEIEHRERIEEQELLLEFLLLMQRRKQEFADNMQDTVSFLSSDIEEVKTLKTSLRQKGGKCSDSDVASVKTVDNDDSGSSASRKRFRPGVQIHKAEDFSDCMDQESMISKNSQLMRNFRKLESAYFLARQRSIRLRGKPLGKHSPSSDGKGSIVVTERSSRSDFPLKESYREGRRSGWIGSFLDGLCKYMSFSNLKVKANLKQGDLLHSSNLVCALSFDRDGEFFATAGVNKKIKVFEYPTISNEDRDIHYPVVEMASRSKLSSICWNGYIKSQIASSNFDGVVQVWDVTRSEVFMEMREHERRVWSIDFSSADPTMLASGSDDGCVKLWNINQGTSVGTIKTKANVCCVQFPFDSGRYLAFGSADHKIYYFDLRNLKVPLCTLTGHNKTVSYVKFIDSTNLVSASTDNTLKLWDLSMCTSRIIDSPLQSFTGHTNVKNFVGLSVSEGYIATGSETNEVFIYHKSLPMPALSFKFNNSEGNDVDDPAQFISSVCWRPQSSTLVAANSTGNIKLLEMV